MNNTIAASSYDLYFFTDLLGNVIGLFNSYTRLDFDVHAGMCIRPNIFCMQVMYFQNTFDRTGQLFYLG